MRPGQQQNRRRGRHNGGHNGHGGHSGNRKPQNPLARSYESNGPDVKVRGTPAHIAEKYMSLARDALSSGDPVLAENYLQHAEHYNRIIMAYREQMQAGDPNVQPQRFRAPNAPFDPMDGDEFGGEDGQLPEDGGAPGDDGLGPQPPLAAGAPQDGQPGDRQPPMDRPMGDRPERFDRQDRYPRQERFDRQGGGGPRPDRSFEGQGGDRQEFRRDRFQDRNRQNGDHRQRDRFNDRGPGGYDNRRDRPFDRDRGGERYGQERSPQDRPPQERQDRGEQRLDRGDRQGFNRQDRYQQPHERHVPERRPPLPGDQPAVDWQPPPPVERAEPAAEAPRPEVQAEPSVVSEPVVKAEAEAPRATRAPRARRAAPAAPSGERFNEDDQPGFLKRPTRRPKAEPKADPSSADEGGE